jgi:hypothetical protein
MSADEATQGQAGPTRRRRGRPPGALNKAGSARRRKVDGGDLIDQLNSMIAELIKENRKLKREVDKLTARGSATASKAVERSLRTIQRRVQRALTPMKGRRSKSATAASARKKPVTRRRRKSG